MNKNGINVKWLIVVGAVSAVAAIGLLWATLTESPQPTPDADSAGRSANIRKADKSIDADVAVESMVPKTVTESMGTKSSREDSGAKSDQALQLARTEPSPEQAKLIRETLEASGVLFNSDRPVHELQRTVSQSLVLKNAMIDTEYARLTGERLEVPEAFRAPEDAGTYIIQFENRISLSDKRRLEESGCRLGGYIPHNAMLVLSEDMDRNALERLDGVRYVEPYHPYYKLDEQVRDVIRYADDGGDTLREYTLASFSSGAVDDVLREKGADILHHEKVLDREYITFTADAGMVADIARAAAVTWIQPRAQRSALNDLGDKRVRATVLKKLHPSLTGQGVTVAVTDTGVDHENRGFAIDPSLPTGTNTANSRIAFYARRPSVWNDGLPGDTDGHGTHVSGTVLGNGALSDTVSRSPGSGAGPYTNDNFAGIAPDAKLVMIEDFSSFTDSEQANTAYQKGARISNNSWGNPTSYVYDIEAQIWDGLVRDSDDEKEGEQSLITIFAAGNEGNGDYNGLDGVPNTIRSPGCSKNVITIGALEQRRYANNLPNVDQETDSDWQVAYFSSRGPVTAFDKRIKPDMVAPGSFVLSLQSHQSPNIDDLEDPGLPHRDYEYGNVESGTNYAFLSGTSMAAPVASGAAALLYQWYQDWYGEAPSPAVMKALMICGARGVHSLIYNWNWARTVTQTDNGWSVTAFYGPYAGYSDPVDEGWGVIDVVRTVDGANIFPGTGIQVFDQNSSVSPGETDKAYEMNVKAGQGGVKIVLAWSDPPASIAAGSALVNDLLLRLVNEEGRGYMGNVWRSDGTHSLYLDDLANNAEFYETFWNDEFNNVEVIMVPDIAPGKWTIEVDGLNVFSDSQDYALVIMPGIGIQGRIRGREADMTLDRDGNPVLVMDRFDNAATRQIYAQRWKGEIGDGLLEGSWHRMEDQWFDIEGSSNPNKTGISKSFGHSVSPSVACFDERIYVAWQQEPHEEHEYSRIYFKYFDGTNWLELGTNSAHGWGISGEETEDRLNPQVAVMTNGWPIVAWHGEAYNASGFPIGQRVYAKYWNGANWVGLAGSDTTGLPTGGSFPSVGGLTMVSDSFRRPYVAWEDATIQRIRVVRWNGASWVALANQGNSPIAYNPDLAAGPNGDIYLAWMQTWLGDPINYHTEQAYVRRFNGSAWSSLGNSASGSGVSRAAITNPMPRDVAVSASSNGFVNLIWTAGDEYTNSAVFLRRYDGAAWSGLSGSDRFPGISAYGGIFGSPVSESDAFGYPIIAVTNSTESLEFIEELMVFGYETDRSPPVFNGLESAKGGTNLNVLLDWDPARDNISTNITYYVFMGTTSTPCGVSITCDPDDVFSNLIAVLTNTTSYEVTNLVLAENYCFGVRAEDQNGLRETNTITRSAGPWTGTADPDADCLNNIAEDNAGTDPCLADTDGDGMQDGWEWTFSTNNPGHTTTITNTSVNPPVTNIVAMDPLDYGVSNSRQDSNADLDGDGAANIDEYLWWLNNGASCVSVSGAAYGVTNSPDPTRVDTDGDGMGDGYEMYVTNLNPVVWNAGTNDLDGDGLDDRGEYNAGTDPYNPDTDGDGLQDGNEVTNTLTDPLLADTDLDGLDDGYELQIGADPVNAVSLSGFFSDGDLFQLGWTNAAATNCLRLLVAEDFETASRTNWIHYPPDLVLPFDFWHLTTTDPAPQTNGIRYEHSRSTNMSYRMANDMTRWTNGLIGLNADAVYNIGGGIQSLIHCALQAPTIDASAEESLFMQWNEYYETEPHNDFVAVHARGGDDPQWKVVSSEASGISTYIDDLTGVTKTGWVHRTADLNSFAGESNVQVRFIFQTRNAVNNDFRGWWVDDVVIYGARTVKGWVRNADGAPIERATVYAVGRGGITNMMQGQRVVMPGKVFQFAQTASDGSYTLNNLLCGRYYVKAVAPSYRAEFYNGELFNNPYGFGKGNTNAYPDVHPGVYDRDQVSSNGWIDVTGLRLSYTNCHFELDYGKGRSYLGVAFSLTGETVYVDNAVAVTWNGSSATPASIPYEAVGSLASLAPNYPDWIDNPVAPALLSDYAPGRHWVGLSSNFPFILPILDLREGEITRVRLMTNQAKGLMEVVTEDFSASPIWVDGQVLTNMTPTNLLTLPVGRHLVSVVPTSGVHVALKDVEIKPLLKTRVEFTEEDLYAFAGPVEIRTENVFGDSVSGAAVSVNGRLYTNYVTPTVLTNLASGLHYIRVTKNGYQPSEMRAVNVFAEGDNVIPFIIYDADMDFDGVGDATEAGGYTNIYLYDRDDDPDGDSLNNLYEFDVFRATGIRANPFMYDTDRDGMSDGEEVGYDGNAGSVAYSRLAEPAVAETNTLRIFFSGKYLRGIDNFGSNGVVAAVGCDRFEATRIGHYNESMPSPHAALTILSNIPPYGLARAISEGHFVGDEIYADTLLDRRDTDGDGMWDGFEYRYRFMDSYTTPGVTNQILYPLQCGGAGDDPDADGLTNLQEFNGLDERATDILSYPIIDVVNNVTNTLGFPVTNLFNIGDETITNRVRGFALLSRATNLTGVVTNYIDWLDPRDSDTDNDQMPDGWEYRFDLDPNRDETNAYVDADGDGLLNISEFYFGSYPNDPDSDGDFLPDGDEYFFRTKPLIQDTDGDGLWDGREVADKDLDGVYDGGFFPYRPLGDLDLDGKTDGPLDWDTDGDGMPDGFEVLNAFGVMRNPSLDPYDPTDADDDPDNDGLTSLQEYLVRDALFGNHPSEFTTNALFANDLEGVVWDYSTDPFNGDSDGDGMPDGWEVAYGLHPMDPLADIDPLIPEHTVTNWIRTPELYIYGDLDQDGLWNRREFRVRFTLNENAQSNAVYGESTHPWIADTDEDGLQDGEEDRAYRAHPILQDTDGDRLNDGNIITSKWGEVDTGDKFMVREFEVLAISNLTWREARDLASTLTLAGNSNVYGQLAVLDYPNDGYVVSNLVVPGINKIAIGGYNSSFTNELGWEWIDGSWFVEYYNFWNPAITGFNPFIIEDTFPNYLMTDTAGVWYAIAPTQRLDGMVVEYRYLDSTLQNHFDRALGDLWKLVFPANDLPFWTEVKPSGDKPLPRWGAAMSYNPVIEKKKDRYDPEGEGQVLMDNRKLVLMGGRDGDYRFSDIYEFNISNQRWTRSTESLASIGLFDGLSEHTLVPLFTYGDTRNRACYCTLGVGDPQCYGEDFGEPKSRPWNDSPSLDWFLFFGGWDRNHAYQGGWWFYSSSDDQRALTEDIGAMVAASEYWNKAGPSGPSSNSVLFAKDMSSLGDDAFGIGMGLYDFDGDGTIAEYLTGYAGINYPEFVINNECDQLMASELRMSVRQAPTSSVAITVVAEINRGMGMSPPGYDSPLDDLEPSTRWTDGSWLRSAPQTIIVTPTNDIIVLDVTDQVNEILASDRWLGQAIGFLFQQTSSEQMIVIATTSTVVRATYAPSYALDAQWDTCPVTIEYHDEDYCTELFIRKNAAVVSCYEEPGGLKGDNETLVMFGGINGDRVFGDTFEGTVTWTGNEEFDEAGGYPGSITWAKRRTPVAPCPRWGHAMVYDHINDRVLLFGGFDANHQPLNDLWEYYPDRANAATTNATGFGCVWGVDLVENSWQEIITFTTPDRPQPRGGASMVWGGGFDYNRGFTGNPIGPYEVWDNNRDAIILFGGTDGNSYFNDTWVYEPFSSRWVLAQPNGEMSKGPSPRAFASFTWAQNSERIYYETDDEKRFLALGAGWLYGGYSGTLVTGKDTDRDFVDDGWEYELGGPAAGRDPRVNKLIEMDSAEIVPYAIKRMGAIPSTFLVTNIFFVSTNAHRGYVAELESLRHDYLDDAINLGLPSEFPQDPYITVSWEQALVADDRIGVQALLPEQYPMWYTRYGGENPLDERNVWALGVPDRAGASETAVPPYAYSGRWCWGTDLNGRYPNDAIMYLYSPLLSLTFPSRDSTSTNYMTPYHVIFHEWLDLAKSNDVVRVELIRPKTSADILTRTSPVEPLQVVPNRNWMHNTDSEWRRITAPLLIGANETNVYLRFVLQSDQDKNAGGWYIDDIAVVQGGQIDGIFTNVGPEPVEVSLLGTNYNGHVQATTLTGTEGGFGFGLLPVGNYRIGSRSTVWDVPIGSGSPEFNLTTNLPGLAVSGFAPGNPTTIYWNSVPGLTYQLQYTTNMADWLFLYRQTAVDDSESFDDWADDGSRAYRVLLESGL